MHTEERELSIDTETGLQDFLQCTKELYAALVAMAESQTATNPQVAAQLTQAEETYHRVRDVVAVCQRSLALGIPLNEVLITEIQTHYNTIATLYDLFAESRGEEVQEVPATVDTETFLAAAVTLSEKGKALLERYHDILAVPVGKDELSLARFYYDQLVAEAKRAEVTLNSVEMQRPLIAESPSLQESVTKTLESIDSALNTLDKELDRFFEPEDASVPATNMADVQSAAIERKDKRQSLFAPYIHTVLLDERYAAFLKERFHSPTQFEALLKREVEKIEAPSKFDVLLGVAHASAFEFLREMTLGEIADFERYPREEIRSELLRRNISYEVYVDWMHLLADMQTVLAAPPHISFGELFVRAEIELLLYEQSVTDSL